MSITFSDDKTAFAIKTDHGIYINTTGHKVDPSALKSKTMKCSKCGRVYENVTIKTVPHPCECGSIFFEGVKE